MFFQQHRLRFFCQGPNRQRLLWKELLDEATLASVPYIRVLIAENVKKCYRTRGISIFKLTLILKHRLDFVIQGSKLQFSFFRKFVEIKFFKNFLIFAQALESK